MRMYLAQRYMNHIILYTITADVVFGYLLKRFQDVQTALPLAILYLLNIAVLIAVYRFWKLPIFEWDGQGFTVYGISPFKSERCAWDRLEYVCFKMMEEKKGKLKEYLVLHYVTPGGIHKTNLVPMYMVGFSDKLKGEFIGFLMKKGIKLESLPGL